MEKDICCILTIKDALKPLQEKLSLSRTLKPYPGQGTGLDNILKQHLKRGHFICPVKDVLG